MPIGEAALAGIKDNGREWKFTIHGVSASLKRLDEAISSHNLEASNAELKIIGRAFRGALNRIGAENIHPSVEEAVEYFEEDSLDFEFKNWELEEIQEHINYYMNDLYDFADYHRFIVN